MDELTDALIAYCQANLGPAFGNSVNTPKFWNDYAGQIPAPYAVIHQRTNTKQYMTLSQTPQTYYSWAMGVYIFDVFGNDSTTTEGLAKLLQNTLDDCDLKGINFPDLRLFRNQASYWLPVPEIGIGSADAYHRQITFQFEAQGSTN